MPVPFFIVLGTDLAPKTSPCEGGGVLAPVFSLLKHCMHSRRTIYCHVTREIYPHCLKNEYRPGTILFPKVQIRLLYPQWYKMFLRVHFSTLNQTKKHICLHLHSTIGRPLRVQLHTVRKKRLPFYTFACHCRTRGNTSRYKQQQCTLNGTRIFLIVSISVSQYLLQGTAPVTGKDTNWHSFLSDSAGVRNWHS